MFAFIRRRKVADEPHPDDWVTRLFARFEAEPDAASGEPGDWSAAGLFAVLEARRRELGLSKAEVVRRALGPEASPTVWQNIQRGKSPRCETVAALASALGLELRLGPRSAPRVQTAFERSGAAWRLARIKTGAPPHLRALAELGWDLAAEVHSLYDIHRSREVSRQRLECLDADGALPPSDAAPFQDWRWISGTRSRRGDYDLSAVGDPARDVELPFEPCPGVANATFRRLADLWRSRHPDPDKAAEERIAMRLGAAEDAPAHAPLSEAEFGWLDTPEALAERIKATCAAAGISEAQLSRAVGGHSTVVTDLRKGRWPGLRKLMGIARFLGLELYLGPPRAAPSDPIHPSQEDAE